MIVRNARISPSHGIAIYFTLALVLSLALGGCGGEPVKVDENGFPISVDRKVGEMIEKRGERSMVVNASAYTLRPQETKDYAIGVGAWGDELEPGMKAIAVSRDLIPLGLGHETKVTIRGLPGKYRVLDKMNKRWKHKIDICFGDDVAQAREWGKRKVIITWDEPEG